MHRKGRLKYCCSAFEPKGETHAAAVGPDFRLFSCFYPVCAVPVNRLRHSFVFAVLVAVVILAWQHLTGRWGFVEVPAVQMQTLDGEHIALPALRGRPVLVNFWHSYCQSCMQEMPHLVALHEEFSSRGLMVIGVAMSYDDLARVMRLRERRQIPYPLVFDQHGELARAFGDVRATPLVFLLAPDGTVAYNQVGPMSERRRGQLRARIAGMLQAG